MIKQVIVMRNDLNMRKGKMIAQGSHASSAWLANRVKLMLEEQFEQGYDFPSIETFFKQPELEWLNGQFTKICCQIDSEQELLEIHRLAQEAGLISELIQDLGKTEFKGVPTYTCLAIGPDESDKIDAITKYLKLF